MRHCQPRQLAARILELQLRNFGGRTATGTGFSLTQTGRGRIARGHEQRRDHVNRSPPPYHCGMGGHLRLDICLCRRIFPAAFPSQNHAV
jgi:hypothetical protein